jgi:hypothetical protein
MAVLSDTVRTQIWRACLRLNLPWGQVSKTQLRTAINDADNWIDSAASTIPATSYNAALSNPFRSNATVAEKALLLAVVCAARVSPEHVRALLGAAID